MFIHNQIGRKDPLGFLLHKPRNLFGFNLDDYEYRARSIGFESGGGGGRLIEKILNKRKKS